MISVIRPGAAKLEQREDSADPGVESILMFTIAYLSHVARPFSKDELFALATQASENNRAKGISGILLYSGNKFLQVLQGEEDAVNALYQKIALDPRHRNVTLIIKSRTMAKEFGEWSMAFKDLSLDERKLHPELSSFFEDDTADKPDSKMPAQQMLELFRTTYLA